MKRKIHNFVIKALTALNAFSLIYWICWIDCIISWQPYVIMLVNFTWICLVLYANGLVTDTEPYYEKNGKPSPLQIHNLKKIDEAGGYGILLYPDHFELFKNFIDCLKVNDANTAYNYDLLKRRWSDG